MAFIDYQENQNTGFGLDVLERIADARGWDIQSLDNGDRTMVCVGQWCSYQVHFSWQADLKSLHIHCSMDMNLPISKKSQAQELIALINERLWIGHFSLNAQTQKPTYRHTLLMFGSDALKSLEIEEIVETALGECDRFYPAIQFCVWGDKSPQDSMDCALLDCVGQA